MMDTRVEPAYDRIMIRSSTTDHTAFIRTNTRLQPVPLVPEISLYLADETVPLWTKTEEELGEVGLPPPFWAFAWAGGQALARYLLDHPVLVAGKTVLDLAAGSGLVGIAAALAGAQTVAAADIDAFACAAVRVNAQANDVSSSRVTMICWRQHPTNAGTSSPPATSSMNRTRQNAPLRFSPNTQRVARPS